jgi:hypothetical protein
MNSAVPSMYRNAAKELTESKAMRRLAGFQNRERQLLPAKSEPDDAPPEAFKSFFPRIYDYYERALSNLYRECPHLRRPYETSIMPAAAYNLGPATVCRPHRDSANLSFGICAIMALGHFDPKKGGHLVLQELGLVVEFPPGATVLIPSAVLTHYNSRIQQGETRYSFTQYAAGSLFSYIDNGMRSDREVVEGLDLNGDEAPRRSAARRERWAKGLALFPHVDEYSDPS